MGQHDRALIYFDNAIKAAQEARDQALGAYLLGSVTTLPAFQTGLATLDASSKIRARLLTGLATAHVRQGEIEQACRTAGEALRIATRTRTALGLQQVRDVRRQLERWHDSRAVRELDEQLRLAG
jgi:tetratricopeptide (TPR) repeat protein